MITKNEKGSFNMNKFIKSFITSLMIGIPIVIVVCGFLYMNKDSSNLKTEREESVQINSFPDDSVDSLNLEVDQVTSEDISVVVESPEKKSSATLSFAGDVHFSELIVQNYDKDGISALVDEEMLSHMQKSDFFMLNHEFVFSLRGEAMADKKYTLRNDPKYVKILQELGTDGVTIANNHILDFGQNAFLDTLDTLQNAEISYAGGGRNLEEASAPIIRNINGHSIAIFAATRVSPTYDWYASSGRPGIFQTYDSKKLNQAISEAESQYDHIIVYVHWGIERNEKPEEYQRTLAKEYIDSGADLVIGAHPHVLQGFEYYKGVPIIYSLGNFLFSNRTGETLLLNAVFDENDQLEVQLIPCERVDGVLERIKEPKHLFDHLTELSYGAAISENGILLQ